MAFDARVGNPLRKLILVKLADNSDDRGRCFPSFTHMAGKCECSRRTVISHIQNLEEKGFLTITRQKLKNDMNTSNIYKLRIDASESPALGSESPALGGGESPAPNNPHSLEPAKKHVNLKPESISEEIWNDFIEMRKKKKAGITMTVMNAFNREANKAGITLEDAIRISIERNWMGFNADWINKSSFDNNNQQPEPKHRFVGKAAQQMGLTND